MNAQAQAQAQAQEKKTVWVLWGEEPEVAGNEPLKYEFNTQAELDAFLLGISEGDGWFGYDYIERDQQPSLTEFENYSGEDAL